MDPIKHESPIGHISIDGPISKRGQEWIDFAFNFVLNHIEEYTVPQYGDIGEDRVTDDTAADCIRDIKKYLLRHGKNQREGQDALDLLKIAHYACMAHKKVINDTRNINDAVSESTPQA